MLGAPRSATDAMLDPTSHDVQPGGSLRAPSRDGASSVEPLFVGRHAELAQLLSGLDVLRTGKGVAFAISGEAGVGKTRLAAEFTTHARAAGATVAWGRCWEAGGAPSYWPWVEVIRRLVGTEQLDLGAHGLFLAQLVPELAGRFGVVSDDAPSPSDPDSARFRMFDAVGTLLRRAAERAPLVVVIDDLHAGDRASLLLLAFLARTLAECPVLLVGTYRDVDASQAPDLAQPLAELARHARRIQLAGLTASDISTLLRSASGADPSSALVARIHDATAGNAFFVDEVLRALAARDSLTGTDASSVLVPDGVREAVRQRLAAMPPDAVAVLELASVMGREFDATALALAAHAPLADMLTAVDHSVRCGIVLVRAHASGRFQFRHALIRDAVYEALPSARRLALHQAVGSAFEQLAASAPDRYVGELAHHFLVAAPGGDERFVAYAMAAARRALARMAFEEAVSLYQRAVDGLAFIAPDDRRRCELLLGLAEAKEWSNDTAGSRVVFEQAADIARRLDATDLFLRAALGVGAVAARKFTATSRCEGAPELLREALRRIDDADAASRALLLSRLALHDLSTGARPIAATRSAEAVAMARATGDLEVLVRALIARHTVAFGPDALDERAAIGDEMIAIGRELPSRDAILRGHAIRFIVRFERGDAVGAREDLEAHRRLAEELGDPFDRWASQVWTAAVSLQEGRFSDARQHAGAAFDLVRNAPGLHSMDLNGPASFLGHLLLIPHTATEPIPLPDIPLDEYRARYPEISAWRVVILVTVVASGDVAAVRRELCTLSEKRFEDFERNGAWLATMSLISEAIQLVGDVDLAKLAYELLLPFAERNGSVSVVASTGSVSRHLGLLAMTMDRRADAERHFEVARAMHERMRARPHLAKTLHDHARCLLRFPDGDRARALMLVREARSIAADLGMPGLLRSCDELLATAGEGDDARWPDEPRLRRADHLWILKVQDEEHFLADAKGIAYIAELMRHPGREILALDLLAIARPSDDSMATADQDVRSSYEISRARVRDTVVDVKPRKAYERRLETLMDELRVAEGGPDPARVRERREEIEALQRELARSVGLGGRMRDTSDVERARISVTRAIRLALGKIAAVSPSAGVFLATRIKTGTYCLYSRDVAG